MKLSIAIMLNFTIGMSLPRIVTVFWQCRVENGAVTHKDSITIAWLVVKSHLSPRYVLNLHIHYTESNMQNYHNLYTIPSHK